MPKFREIEPNIAEPYSRLRNSLAAMVRLAESIEEIIVEIEQHPDYVNADTQDKLGMAELKTINSTSVLAKARVFFDPVPEPAEEEE